MPLRARLLIAAAGAAAAATTALVMWPWPPRGLSWLDTLHQLPAFLVDMLPVPVFPALLVSLPASVHHLGPPRRDRWQRTLTTACGLLVVARATWLTAARVHGVPAPPSAVLHVAGTVIPALMGVTFWQRGWTGMAAMATANAAAAAIRLGRLTSAVGSVWLFWLAIALLSADGTARPPIGQKPPGLNAPKHDQPDRR
jgi:hypothetical protein